MQLHTSMQISKPEYTTKDLFNLSTEEKTNEFEYAYQFVTALATAQVYEMNQSEEFNTNLQPLKPKIQTLHSQLNPEVFPDSFFKYKPGEIPNGKF